MTELNTAEIAPPKTTLAGKLRHIALRIGKALGCLVLCLLLSSLWVFAQASLPFNIWPVALSWPAFLLACVGGVATLWLQNLMLAWLLIYRPWRRWTPRRRRLLAGTYAVGVLALVVWQPSAAFFSGFNFHHTGLGFFPQEGDDHKLYGMEVMGRMFWPLN